MKKVYKDILKELEKGNAVFVDVRCIKNNEYDRYRLLQGKTCRFNHFKHNDPDFDRSCFTDIIVNTLRHYFRYPKSSEELMTLMEDYDSRCNLEIKKYIVL